MTIELKHPVFSGDGRENTYSEVVIVKKGVAICQKESAAKTLESRGYIRVENKPADKPAKKKKNRGSKDD